MIEYTITMNSDQAHELCRAVELLMRLKLGQYNELPYMLLDLGAKDYCERRDDARPHLEKAFDALFRGKGPGDWKDEQWHRLYDLFQVLRYMIHEAEHPDSIGVDSYPPRSSNGEPLPEWSWCKTVEPGEAGASKKGDPQPAGGDKSKCGGDFIG